jgi:hypothetical protein
MVYLYDVVSRITGEQGHREGRCFKFHSPFRAERTPSFAVYPQTNSWYDFGSGEGGDIISFFQMFYGISYREALCEVEAQSAHNFLRKLPKSVPLPFRPERKPVPSLKPGKETVKAYFSSLGLPYYSEAGAFVLRFNEGEYISFPCPTKRNPAGLECRLTSGNGLSKISMFKKEVWFLQRNHRVLVTESITDCLAGEMILDDRSLSLLAMNGLGNKKRTIEFLGSEVKPKTVLLALDNDGTDNDFAGQKVQAEMKNALSALCSVREVNHCYAGSKDLFRYLKAGGRNGR